MSRTYARFIKWPARLQAELKRPPEYSTLTYYRKAGKRWALVATNWNRAEAQKLNQLLCSLAPEIFPLIQQSGPKANCIEIGPGKPVRGIIDQRKRFVYLCLRNQKFKPRRTEKPWVRVFPEKK